jgi:hypothetical protein
MPPLAPVLGLDQLVSPNHMILRGPSQMSLLSLVAKLVQFLDCPFHRQPTPTVRRARPALEGG